MSVDPRRAVRQDTFDLRGEILAEDSQHLQAHADALNYGTDDEEHSMLEDDSEAEENEDYIDEDASSTLSIPNESIDFDMVYALHSFAATVEGQANVVKGDSLYLMDDSNSYWWLVRVLKTQEVGYIPAENIETPFERLARLNKHRNVDLALATEAENNDSSLAAQDRLRNNVAFEGRTPSPDASRTGSRTVRRRSIHFNSVRTHHRYIPTLREGEEQEEDEEWEDGGFQDEDVDLAAEQMYMQSMDEDDLAASTDPDSSMQWDDNSTAEMYAQQQQGAPIPDALQPGSMRHHEEQLRLRAYQQEQLQQHEQALAQERQQQQQQQLQQQQQAQQQTELQKQQQQQQQQSQATQQAQQSQQALRTVGSRERLAQDGGSIRDPAEVTETRRMTVTPTIAREHEDRPANVAYLPSIVVDEDRKRARDDTSSDESLTKKAKGKEKMAAPVSSATYNKPAPAKLRKEPSKSDTDDEGKKKKSSMFGGLFGGRSKKDKEKIKDRNPSIGSQESGEYASRGSEESSRSGHRPPTVEGGVSPTTSAAQQQQQQAITLRNAVSDIRASQDGQGAAAAAVAPSTPERAVTPQVSEHASQLRERDQQQRDLYKQYLIRSPSSPPEAQPSYGLQSASSVMLSSPSTNSALGPPTTRPRPGSLILTSPSSNDGQANLSVIRVFAGKNLQTEATFKTVLLNASTTANDLVRQAIQRFRLPSGDDLGEYFLTVKQVEGGASAVLQPSERPLVVFETLVTEAMELPKVKRSSMGSISSISSNLSMHPAITKLSMNDFTDDSAVKFYLNYRGDGTMDDSLNGHEGDSTLADMSLSEIDQSISKPAFLSVSTAGGNVASERFSSPSIRFALQLVIYAEDLPDDMQFHPQTEAIVFKSSLPDPSAPVVVSPVIRRKIFMFPKNVTVAEVTELGLERFGIQDGVIDGGDEVEDKTTKRRSGVRVRYGLMVSIDAHERELAPSSKVIDAFPRPPQFRAPDRQAAGNKRRSLDSAQLLGSVDDIRWDDPVFVLRRATSYRNSTSRRRSSAPLDEIALQHLHRESSSSYNSELQSPVDESRDKGKQPSRQEIIAAQRAATRATQRAIVTASTNSVRGMDVVLPGNARLRSARYEAGDRMRYSYVEPDGETYDISDIMEQEWRGMDGARGDLLEGVFNGNKDGISEKLDRVLNKIRKGKGKERERDYASLSSVESNRLSTRSVSISEYSADDTEEGRPYQAPENNVIARATPVAAAVAPSPPPRVGANTPTGGPRATPNGPVPPSRRNPSISSVLSDQQQQQGRGTPPVQSSLARVQEEERAGTPRSQQRRRLVLPKDDFGLAQMMAIIEYKALRPTKALPPLDPVDALLFGRPVDLEALHPAAREIYGPEFKHLEEIDKMLDGYIGRSAVGAF